MWDIRKKETRLFVILLLRMRCKQIVQTGPLNTVNVEIPVAEKVHCFIIGKWKELEFCEQKEEQ